jgi:hypothetical protein
MLARLPRSASTRSVSAGRSGPLLSILKRFMLSQPWQRGCKRFVSVAIVCGRDADGALASGVPISKIPGAGGRCPAVDLSFHLPCPAEALQIATRNRNHTWVRQNAVRRLRVGSCFPEGSDSFLVELSKHSLRTRATGEKALRELCRGGTADE